jgi:hypothetical protein
MAEDEISRLRDRNRELLDLLADAVDMLHIAMMEIHAWHASRSPTEEEPGGSLKLKLYVTVFATQ